MCIGWNIEEKIAEEASGVDVINVRLDGEERNLFGSCLRMITRRQSRDRLSVVLCTLYTMSRLV